MAMPHKALAFKNLISRLILLIVEQELYSIHKSST